MRRPWRLLDGSSPSPHRGGPSSLPEQIVWRLWWIKFNDTGFPRSTPLIIPLILHTHSAIHHIQYSLLKRQAMYGKCNMAGAVQIFLLWRRNKFYIFWVCVCSLSYQACKAHAQCHVVTCSLVGCSEFFCIFS